MLENVSRVGSLWTLFCDTFGVERLQTGFRGCAARPTATVFDPFRIGSN